PAGAVEAPWQRVTSGRSAPATNRVVCVIGSVAENLPLLSVRPVAHPAAGSDGLRFWTSTKTPASGRPPAVRRPCSVTWYVFAVLGPVSVSRAGSTARTSTVCDGAGVWRSGPSGVI